jgi:hypothetical protein
VVGGGSEFILRRSRRKSLQWTAIALVLFGFGGVVELKDSVPIGAASLVLALLSVLVFAPGIWRPRDLVKLSAEGVTQFPGMGRTYSVPWSEVTEISVVRRQKVNSVCVAARDPDAILHGLSRRLWHVGESRWWSPVFKLTFGALIALTEGAGAASDLKDLKDSDVKLHGVLEIPCGAGFPMKAEALAGLLHEWHQRYANASPSAPPAVRERPQTESAPSR